MSHDHENTAAGLTSSTNSDAFIETLLMAWHPEAEPPTQVCLSEWRRLYEERLHSPTGWWGLAVPTGCGKSTATQALAAMEPSGGRRLCIVVESVEETESLARNINSLRQRLVDKGMVEEDHTLGVAHAIHSGLGGEREIQSRAAEAQFLIMTHRKMHVCFMDHIAGRPCKYNGLIKGRLLIVDEAVSLETPDRVPTSRIRALMDRIQVPSVWNHLGCLQEPLAEELTVLEQVLDIMPDDGEGQRSSVMLMNLGSISVPETFPDLLRSTMPRLVKSPDSDAEENNAWRKKMIKMLDILQGMLSNSGVIVRLGRKKEEGSSEAAACIAPQVPDVHSTAIILDGTAGVSPSLGDLVPNGMKIWTPSVEMRSYRNLRITLIKKSSVGSRSMDGAKEWNTQLLTKLDEMHDGLTLAIGAMRGVEELRSRGLGAEVYDVEAGRSVPSTLDLTYWGAVHGHRGTNAYANHSTCCVLTQWYWDEPTYQTNLLLRDRSMLKHLETLTGSSCPKEKQEMPRAFMKAYNEEVARTLAGETIQGINRISCRKATEDGDCREAQVFIVVPDDGQARGEMVTSTLRKALKTEMPGAQLREVTVEEISEELGLTVLPEDHQPQAPKPRAPRGRGRHLFTQALTQTLKTRHVSEEALKKATQLQDVTDWKKNVMRRWNSMFAETDSGVTVTRQPEGDGLIFNKEGGFDAAA